MKILLVAILIVLLNIPFGYWRANVRKFSFQWVLAVHVPVPFVIALRFLFDIGFALYTYPVLVGAFFIGQLLGKLIYDKFSKRFELSATSCLVMDFYRAFKMEK